MNAPRPVRIEVGPSKLAGTFIVLTHLATAALIAWLPGHPALRALVVIGVGAHAVWAIRRSSLRSLPSSIVAAELAQDRRVTLLRRDGTHVSGRALPDSYVGERLATLVFRPDGSRWSQALCLLPDMAREEDLRRFRVLLRLGRPAADT